MPEAHVKPCYLLETPKAQGATDATILEDEAKAEMDNQQVTQIELGWLAGFIDGEGYIGIQIQKGKSKYTTYQVAIQVSNTDMEMVLRAQTIIQKMGINPYIRTHGFGDRNQPNRKTVYVLIIRRMKGVSTVLKIVSPFLTGEKRERAILVLEYCLSRAESHIRGSHYNQYTERESQIVDLCVAKQHRGTSETTRKAQLERRDLMLAKAYINKREYNKERQKDPVHHARTMELQRIRRGIPEGREQEKEYRRQLNIRRKEAIASFPTEDDIVRPFAKA